MANFIDKAIGYINPKAGATRAAYRQRMEILNGARAYEGASGGRLAGNWYAPSTTANGEISKAGQKLRDRSRDLVRNNPLAAKIVTTHANNFVGYGIVPRAITGDEAKNKLVNDLFEEWSNVCLVDNSMDFYGVCYLMARMLVQDGEVYLRKRLRLPEDKLPVPLQLQVLDAEFCDWSKSGTLANNPGNAIVNGIEFDAIGRRRGYWMFAQNPNDPLPFIGGNRVSGFVPAEDIAHFYEPQSSQVHGVPWLSPVMMELRNLSDYELAENIRKKIEACSVGMIIPNETDNTDPNVGISEALGGNADAPGVRDLYGNPFERMEPGMFGVLAGGKDIKFNNPAMSVGVEAYIRTRHRSIAAGVRLPYELMTGDFSQSNFASGKMGMLDYQCFVASIQWHFMIPQVMQKVWGWFIEAAKIGGKLPMNLKVGVEWTPPEFESVTRLDDARADLLEIRMGKRSQQEVISKTGRDPMAVLNEIDEWNQAVDKTVSKVTLDSDPRKVSAAGQIQWGLTEGNSNGDGNAKKE